MNLPNKTQPIFGSIARPRAGGLLTLLALPMLANGATLRWVPAGAGDWDITSVRWDSDGPGPLPPGTWTQKDVAILGGGTSGGVNIVGLIEASRVIFETDGYVLSGGPLTMIEQSPGDFVDFVANAGITGTVNAEIVSPGDIWVNYFGETGTVVFGADNSYAGKTSVRGGVLELGGTLGSTVIDVETNATLRLSAADRLNDAAVVTSGALAPGGTVELNGDDTIGVYNSDGGSLTGSGTLTAGNYNLSNGASTDAGAHLGAGQLVVDGAADVTLNGNAEAEDVDVNGGTLNVNGELTGVTDLTIAPGATMTLGSGERLNDAAVVNNNGGNLNLGGVETIETLNSTGQLGGNGTLNATGYNLSDGASTLAGANLGGGQLNVGPGAVTLWGDAAAEDVNVNSGMLNLNGQLTGVTELDVSSGASVNLGGAERINDTATVNNNGGSLSLNGAETIGEYNSVGQLNGTGTLTAGNYNLSNGAMTGVGANLGGGQLSSGPGQVTLNGDAASEDVDVNSGTLNLNGELTGATNLTISDGATLLSGSADRVADGATVNIDSGGLWTLGGDDTVGALNSSGLLNGPANLTASQYNLSNGAEVASGTNLGTGQLNSGPGEVTLSGDAAAEDVNVNSGMLNLNGELTGVTDLTISDGATLSSGDAERVADGAVVNIDNGGIWTLSGDETVSEFNSSGLLNGGATLNASKYDLSDGAEVSSGTNLGAGQLVSSSGSVDLSGDAAAEDVDVTGGTLNLNGQLTGVTDLTISNGATLASGSGDRVADGATVNLDNGGIWALNGDETVSLFNSSGLLNSSGTLSAPSYNLSNGAQTAAGANLGSGQLNSGPGDVTLNGDSAAEDVNVDSGNLNLNGEMTAVSDLAVASGATLTLGSNERINSDAVLNNNGGTVTLGGEEEVNTLNSTGELNGAGTLTAGNYNLSNGAMTASGANLGSGQLSSGPGTVTLNGDAGAEDVDVDSGTLNLNGQLTGATDLTVSSGAILNLGSDERISDGAMLNNNDGIVTLNGVEAIETFNSTGQLGGSGVLTAADYNFSNGASTSFGANLGTGIFNAGPGSVVLNGNTNADFLNVNSGSLTTEGEVQNPGGVISVGEGATWFVNGAYSYDSLQGAGTVDPGGANGDTFTNSTNLRPGTSIGSISVVGDYIEAGVFHGELDPSPLGSPYLFSDNLAVSGGTTLTATSVLSPTTINGLTADGVLIGHRFKIITSVGGISGGWSEITDGNNSGPGGSSSAAQFFFDTATGDLLGLGLTGTQTPADYPGANSNHEAILNAITDGATDDVGNYNSADGAEGTLLDEVYSNGAPGDVGSRLGALDALSPEGYAGAIDYTLHATRVYSETVRNAAPLAGDSRYAIVAGFSHFNMASSASGNSHDYDLSSSGGYVGARVRGNKDFTFGGFVGFDGGDIDAGRIDLDASGFVFGGFVEYNPSYAKALSYWGNMSYGTWEFDGKRRGLVSSLSTPSFDGSAFQAGFGMEYLAYEKNGLRMAPSGSLNFISSSVDGFRESGGLDALSVDDLDADATYLELAFHLHYQLPRSPVSLRGHLGWQHNFGDVDHDVSATLGGSSFTVNAPGVGSDAVILGFGVQYDFNKQYQLNLNYRGEFRGDSDAYTGFNFGVKGSF